MILESKTTRQESGPKITIEEGFEEFVPSDFKNDPIGYFEQHGANIKSGEVIRDESGKIKEDPTAVKDFPVWTNESGEVLNTVAKKVNTVKSQVSQSGNPFHEYEVMKIAQEFGLPCPKPVARVEQDDVNLIVMEKARGVRWIDRDANLLKEKGYTEIDIDRLKEEATVMMEELSQKYETIGLFRTWQLKDMVFDLDIEARVLKGITPTDWERTKIDRRKLAKARIETSN